MPDDGENLPEIPRHLAPDPFDDATMREISEIQARAEHARSHAEPHTKPGASGGSFDGDSGRGLADGLSIAYALIGMPMVGILVGWLLDKSSGGGNWTAILTLGGVGLGVIFMLLVLARQNRRK